MVLIGGWFQGRKSTKRKRAPLSKSKTQSKKKKKKAKHAGEEEDTKEAQMAETLELLLQRRRTMPAELKEKLSAVVDNPGK
jgi:hypothetical protein